jgi:hypothetical protein
MEPELDESGAAGAVAVESVLGELGDVDCCLEHAEMAAKALRVNTRRLRFINITSMWLAGSPAAKLAPGWTERSVARPVP